MTDGAALASLGPVVEPLTRARAEREAEAILGAGRDLSWDNWTREHLLSDRPGKWELSLLATVDGRPVGYAVASRKEDDVHLHHIVVAPGLRGSGLGREMIDRLRARAADAGAARVTLKVYRDNANAIRFYEREGFAVVDEDASLLTMAAPVRSVAAP